MARQDELLAMLESGESRSGRGGFFAGWIETDYIFVQLLRVGQVHLAFFELSDLEQFLRFVRAAGDKHNTEHNSPYVDPLSH
jgi:hypothetical protein